MHMNGIAQSCGAMGFAVIKSTNKNTMAEMVWFASLQLENKHGVWLYGWMVFYLSLIRSKKWLNNWGMELFRSMEDFPNFSVHIS